MSRIFDALSRTDGGYEDLLRPLQEQGAETTTDFVARQPAPPSAEWSTLPSPGLQSHVRVVDLRIPRQLPVLPFDGVHNIAGEEYRRIRTRILQHPMQPRVLMVSSPCPGDGKTITATNLGGALALKGSVDVLVVDADFARGTLESIVGIPDSPGLGQVLTGKVALEDAIVRAAQFPRLHFLVAGQSAANPAELLESEIWLRLLETLRKRFGYVVLDSPPVEAVPYYARLAAACDGMVLVARPDHTGRGELNDALRSVPKDKLLGMVLNCNRRWFLYTKDSGSYGYYYSKV